MSTPPRRVGHRGGSALGHPGRGDGGGEDGVRAVDRPAILVVEDHVDLGHLAGGQDAEGPDGEVERDSVGVDRDPLGPDQAQRLMDRADDVGAQGDGIEEFAGPDLDR